MMFPGTSLFPGTVSKFPGTLNAPARMTGGEVKSLKSIELQGPLVVSCGDLFFRRISEKSTSAYGAIAWSRNIQDVVDMAAGDLVRVVRGRNRSPDPSMSS
jgi:hypothetical protein